MATKRNLPMWMVRSDDQSSKKPLTSPIKAKPGEDSNKTARNKRPRRKMEYWMNERELVDTALNILKTHSLKTDVSSAVRAPDPTVIPETDGSNSDEHEKTYVSESDLDITEQETVPYADRCSERATTRLHSADERSGYGKKKAEVEDITQRTNSDHEALQLVREIFFS